MYQITSGKTKLDLDKESLKNFDIRKIDDQNFHIILNQNSFRVNVSDINIDDSLVKLRVNGKEYEVKVETELEQRIASMGLNRSKKKNEDLINAPMPGLVLKVLVEKGQSVTKGEALLVLEAMKMENVIKSPHDGVIEDIFVVNKDKVDKGQLLVKFLS
ncbi:MAG: acetyl-CoA carboxylase biotin carboxyl carrier protein subunit [Saprospiraceae bacterium]